MPNTVLDSRVRAAYRAHAVVTAVAFGAQVFSTGAGISITLSLNAAYLSLLPCLLLAALLAFLAQHRLARGVARRGAFSRALHLVLGLTLLYSAIFMIEATSCLREQTLLPQAQVFPCLMLTLAVVLLCALLGSTGAARLSFSLRLLLPAVLLLLTGFTIPHDNAIGLFPLLGTGLRPLLLSALLSLSSCAPLGLLLMPPRILEGIVPPPRALPGAWFFIWRVLLGGLVGGLLLMALSLCHNYETLMTLDSWGKRMLILCSSAPHSGGAQLLLALGQSLCLLLGAVSMLCAAEEALCRCFPVLLHGRLALFLCAALALLALLALLCFGSIWALRTAPALLLPMLFVFFLAPKFL